MRRPFALLALFASSIAFADVRVAVVPFDNAGGAEFEGLGVGLQSMVTTDLSQADEVTVVERAKLQDLLAEMQLAKDGVLDPATALEIGRVSGATHVVAGSFTVVGDRMRLDARLANVQTGEITVAEDIAGERDAFFELEKDLVKKLLVSLGAELSPKERAAVSRLHTADFESFSQFSKGVALFDADRYDEAVAILESVAQSDSEFKLAALTLSDIRAVQEQAEKKAIAARVANAEEAFVVYQEAARKEADIVARLQADATDTKKSWQERATANLLLVSASGIDSTGLRELRKSTDEFALERMGERAYQAYWAELRDRAPDYYPIQRDWWTSLSMEKYTYEEHFERNLSRFFTGTNPNYLVSSCTAGGFGSKQLAWLWVPKVRQLELEVALLGDMRGCLGEKKYLDEMFAIAKALEREGRIGQSTAILKQLADASQDERLLTRIASQAAVNATRKEITDGFSVGSPEWELAAVRRQNLATVERSRAAGKVLSDVSYYVRGEYPNVYGPFFLSGVPIWAAKRFDPDHLLTGPRTSHDESASIRYYGETREKQSPHAPQLLVLGGIPRRDGTVRVTLDFRPAEDWWPLQRRRNLPEAEAAWQPVPDAPLAGIVLSLREVETDPLCDPVDPTAMTPIPSTGFGVLVRDGELVIAELEEAFDEPDRCNHSPNSFQRFAVKKVLASKPMKATGRFELTATVDGTKLTATAGKLKLSATLPDSRAGFPALYAEGGGYVEFAAPALE